MTMTERAKKLLIESESMGCTPVVEGNFVVFRPPLAAPLIVEATQIGDQIHAAMAKTAEQLGDV